MKGRYKSYNFPIPIFPVIIFLSVFFGEIGKIIVEFMFLLGVVFIAGFYLLREVFLMKMRKGEVEVEFVDEEV